MNPTLTSNTQAILLLTAPLLTGSGQPSMDLLTPGEYKRLAVRLREFQHQPADLIVEGASKLIQECRDLLDPDRLNRLLERGFQLGQAVDRWQTRAIWVISRADSQYPRCLKAKLREDAPAVLYGCGDIGLLEKGGLAVVGSRNVDPGLLTYADRAGRLCAAANSVLVSGGAKGIDQASMRGALDADGRAIGVLADSLDRASLAREHRNLLMEERLVLVSPYDPSAGFNVGHAMQRNKLIYALADAALVVNSDFQKGGTWAGAVEQLDKLRLVPVYVRSPKNGEKGMEGLRRKGARLWPENMDPRDLRDLLVNASTPQVRDGGALDLTYGEDGSPVPEEKLSATKPWVPPVVQEPVQDPIALKGNDVLDSKQSAQDVLFETVRELVLGMNAPVDETSLIEQLGIEKGQAKVWLKRLAEEGAVITKKRGQRPKAAIGDRPLFEDSF